MEPNQQVASAIITKSSLKERLIQRTFSSHNSIKSVFDEWRLPAHNGIEYERLRDLVSTWGFMATEAQVQELFKWLDHDGDGEISFEDLRESVGLDVAPKEAVYFR